MDELKEKILVSYKYNPDTGEIIGPKGIPLGKIDNKGYKEIRISLNGKIHYARYHRVAWLLYYKEWPKNKIDHIDGDKLNNKINNLRDVTQRQNNINRPLHRKGKLPGSIFRKQYNKYEARAVVNGKQVYLGRYDTEKEAHNVYINYVKSLNLL